MAYKKVVLPVAKDKSLILKFIDITDNEEIDLDRVLRVDVANIALELTTFPVLLNQIGFLMAEANFAANMAKLNLELTESRVAQQIREEYFEKNDKQLSNERVSEAVTVHPEYRKMKVVYFQRLKEQEQINSFYWSAKSKDTKLDKLTMSVQTGDIEEALINNKLRQFNYTDLQLIKANNKL